MNLLSLFPITPIFILVVIFGLAGFMPRNKQEAEAWGIFIAYLVAIIVTVVYFILPIDLIPDPAIGIGQVDDIGVGVLAFSLATAMAQAMTPQRRGRK